MAIVRGRLLTFLVTALAVGVVVAVVIAAREPILERWYIHKLSSDSLDESTAAAMELGRRASVRAVRPVLEAMKKFSAGSGRAPIWMLVGPDHPSETDPSEAPPSSWPQLSYLKFFQQLDALAVPGLVEAMRGEDETVARFATTMLVYRATFGEKYRHWFHQARFYRLPDAAGVLAHLKVDDSQPASTRSAAADLLARIRRR
jgi:hypothetical protein